MTSLGTLLEIKNIETYYGLIYALRGLSLSVEEGTITAILGSLSSNTQGKRLAGAHLIFNLVTGLIAIAGISKIMTLVDELSRLAGIAGTDYTLKLAIFHSVFNLFTAGR